MYIAGHPVEGVLASNQRVIEAIQGLNPVLIYFAIDDLRAFVARTILVKEEEWRLAGLEGSWSQHIYEEFDSQKWATDHRCNRRNGHARFVGRMAQITEELSDRMPFPKIKSRNPHQDWTLAMQQMRGFLGLV